MDPSTQVAARALGRVISEMFKTDLEAWPTVLLSQTLRQLLELSEIVSDELDGRRGS